MYTTEKLLKEKFITIKNSGWIKSVRKGPTGVGATFEQLLGLDENNLEIPDLLNIEIKTHRNYSESYISLFNCTPEGPHYHEIERLKNLYGYPDKRLCEYKILNVSLNASHSTIVRNLYLFKLIVDREEKVIKLQIGDIFLNTIEKEVYWSFDLLEEKLYRKLKYVAYIYAKRKILNNYEYFNYYKLDIYKLKSFEDFIRLIEDGKIRVTFKISVFRSGARFGQIHDHGTSFSIKKDNLHLLYDIINFE